MTPTCTACDTARRQMKADGFRNWRDYACAEHAVLNLDDYLAERQAKAGDLVEQSQ